MEINSDFLWLKAFHKQLRMLTVLEAWLNLFDQSNWLWLSPTLTHRIFLNIILIKLYMHLSFHFLPLFYIFPSLILRSEGLLVCATGHDDLTLSCCYHDYGSASDTLNMCDRTLPPPLKMEVNVCCIYSSQVRSKVAPWACDKNRKRKNCFRREVLIFIVYFKTNFLTGLDNNGITPTSPLIHVHLIWVSIYARAAEYLIKCYSVKWFVSLLFLAFRSKNLH